MKTDSQLQQDVLDELKWEPSVEAAHIGVSANSGVVTLTGHVTSYAEKYGAEKAAKRLYGVKAVANELDVKLAGSSKRSDEEIAQACLSAFRSNCSVPDDKIKLIVRNGWVTLEGEVEWQYQKNIAENAIRYLIGVAGISNDIKLKPHVSAADVKSKIETAFKRNAEIDARRVTVETLNGKVSLYGNVSSWMERDEALNAASAAPGVTSVENHITVTP